MGRTGHDLPPGLVKRLALLAPTALIAFVVFLDLTAIAGNDQLEKELREEFLDRVRSEEEQRIAALRAKIQSLRENKEDVGNLRGRTSHWRRRSQRRRIVLLALIRGGTQRRMVFRLP